MSTSTNSIISLNSSTSIQTRCLQGSVLIGFILSGWTAVHIINRPYTYPIKYWAFFIVGMICATLAYTYLLQNRTHPTYISSINAIQSALLIMCVVLSFIIITRKERVPVSVLGTVAILHGYSTGTIAFHIAGYYGLL